MTDSPKQPSHIMYHVKDTNKLDNKGNKKGIWTRIGSVWPTKTGNGSHILLDYTPVVPGRIIMLPYPAKEDEKSEVESPWEYEMEVGGF